MQQKDVCPSYEEAKRNIEENKCSLDVFKPVDGGRLSNLLKCSVDGGAITFDGILPDGRHKLTAAGKLGELDSFREYLLTLNLTYAKYGLHFGAEETIIVNEAGTGEDALKDRERYQREKEAIARSHEKDLEKTSGGHRNEPVKISFIENEWLAETAKNNPVSEGVASVCDRASAHANVGSQIGAFAESDCNAAPASVTVGSVTRIVVEATDMRENDPKKKGLNQHEIEASGRSDDMELEKKTDSYRKDAKEEAELIRKELEKQDERPKKIFGKAIGRHPLEQETKYAKKEQQREHHLTEESLDKSRVATNIDASMDAFASGSARTVSKPVNTSEVREKEKKSLFDKFKSTFGRR
ncbi:uncharacterized protein LOC129592102 [Paramacrobiotus metropolitanus]|uniref:uncharacterized protein LOC129592102 n=1 Tax=Paramacrobiotus metropolitanus TaxID=2943436 RepID=UPI002445ED22|nr:uncharacterized protein LOC129592102 [Paramacrobiotus metropolitanus]